MRKLLIFPEGVGVIPSNSKTIVKISGQDPVEELEGTQENLKEYFTEEELTEAEIKVK